MLREFQKELEKLKAQLAEGNARDHGCLVGTKQHKFTENRFKSGINS